MMVARTSLAPMNDGRSDKPRSVARRGRHAVVIGASIAGLCAGRVLSDFYDQVTLFDRDTLPEHPANRAAVPQGRHVHILMSRGAQEFGALFPGLLDDMVAAGVPILEDQPGSIHFGAAGHVLGIPTELEETFTTYVPSRPQLEWQIRRHAGRLPNVAIRQRAVSAPRFDAAAQRVTGRGPRLPVWLQEWGFERPIEDTVDVGIGYATQQLRIPDGLIEEKVVVAGASRAQPVGIGMLFYEAGTWGMTTFGVGKVEPPRKFSEMCDAADAVLPEHAAPTREAQPIGEIASHKYPTSRWRRYDKLTRYPTGIVPFGDAVVSFNPTYGQGMTMTSLQAGHLRRALESPDADIARQLNRATAKTTYPVWTMNAIGDQAFHNASGPMPRWYRPGGGPVLAPPSISSGPRYCVRRWITRPTCDVPSNASKIARCCSAVAPSP